MKKANVKEIKTNTVDGKKIARIITSLLLPPVETIILVVEAAKDSKAKKMATPPDIPVDDFINKNEPKETPEAEEGSTTEEGS